MSAPKGSPGNFMGSAVVGGGMQLPKPVGGDVNIGYRIEIAATVTCAAAAIVVALRFQARFKYARLGWDDYLMAFALLQAVIATIIDFVATHWGLGRHLYYLNPEQRVKQQYYSLLAQVFCIHSLTFCKISISLTYVRILKGSYNNVLKMVCHAISISVLVVNTMVIIVFYAQCIPNEKAWNPSIQGTCYDRKFLMGFVLLQGSFSAFTDLALCIIPIFLLKDLLQVGRRSKAILLIIMGLGLVTAIFGIIRTKESSAGLKPAPPDNSYTSISGLVWAGMERNIAILLGSIPQCRPLVVPVANYTKATFSRLTYGSSKRSKGDSYALDDSLGTKKSNNTANGRIHTIHTVHTVDKPQRALPSNSSQENILPTQAHQAV